MTNHGRSKYKRTVNCLETPSTAVVDVYSVLEAFAVTCPARQHLIKKILCTGIRGKGGSLQDLEEAKVALDRAIVLEKNRLQTNDGHGFTSVKWPDVTTPEQIFSTHRKNPDERGWRTYMVTDERGVNPIGFRVGWPCEDGRTFMVAHYMAAEEGQTGPSLNWCKNAAESQTKQFNEIGKRPEEWSSFQQETKTNV